MADITRISNVQIALQTTGVTEQGFNTILILAPRFTEAARVLSYSDPDQALTDGAAATSPVYRALTDAFSQTPRPAVVKVGQILEEETPVTALAACQDEDFDWYGIAAVTRTQSEVIAIAEWAEAHTKLFGTATSDPNAKLATSTADALAVLKNNNFFRSFGFYHADAATDYPEIAVMARCFAALPGGETWANMKLAGVTTDKLTETEFNAIKGKNGNTFEPFRNITITQRGTVGAGEWIDVIRFRDWLAEDMQNRIFLLLVNNDKVPFTDNGIRLIEAAMRASLELGQTRGGIAGTEYTEDGDAAPGFTVSVPLSSSVSFNDKANRILRDAKFTAYLAGAIHVVQVYGTLTYNGK